MTHPDKKRKRKEFAIEERAIREILHDWEPIGFSTPDDEYDCLVHHLLSVLHADGTARDLADKIKDELENHFGLSSLPPKQIESIASKIRKWWDTRNS